MKKRTWIWIAACVLILLSLGGCGKKAEDAGEQQETQSSRQKLVLWTYFETQAQREGMDILVRDFNQSQNVYQAEWEYVPMIGFNKSLSSAYTENNLPDMAILDNPDMPEMIQLGLFEDITEQVLEWKIPENFYSSIVETTCYEGKYYGVPFNCNNTALIYNRAILEEAGVEPPQTLEELKTAAQKLMTEERAGFLMCAIEGEQGAFQILSWILAAGEQIDTLGSEKTAEAFAFLEELLDAGSLSENCINLTQTDVAREFVDGKAAIMQNGPWVFPMLEEAGIDYGVIPIPDGGQGTAVVGGENIGILKGKNLEGSLDFIRFCMEQKNIVNFCERADVLPGNMELAAEMEERLPGMAVFAQQMETAITRTSVLQWSLVREVLPAGILQMISGEKTPEEVAALVREIQLK